MNFYRKLAPNDVRTEVIHRNIQASKADFRLKV